MAGRDSVLHDLRRVNLALTQRQRVISSANRTPTRPAVRASFAVAPQYELLAVWLSERKAERDASALEGVAGHGEQVAENSSLDAVDQVFALVGDAGA